MNLCSCAALIVLSMIRGNFTLMPLLVRIAIPEFSQTDLIEPYDEGGTTPDDESNSSCARG